MAIQYTRGPLEFDQDLSDAELNGAGLITQVQKDTPGAPVVTVLYTNKFIPGAIIQVINGTIYQNIGTTVVPLFSLIGGGGGTPGGANTYVQYNDNGVFGGDSNFTWDKLAKDFVVGDLSDTSGGMYFALDNSGFGNGTPNISMGNLDPLDGTNLEIKAGDGINVRVNSNISGRFRVTDTISNTSGLTVYPGPNNTFLTIDDGAQTITAQTTGNVNLGDVSGLGFGTVLNLNDGASSIIMQSPIGVAFSANVNTRLLQLGDISGVGNNTLFAVDDLAQTIRGQAALGVVSFGDTQALGNGTSLMIDDLNRKISLTFLNMGVTLTAYDNDAAAGVGGLITGELYQASGGDITLKVGTVMVKQ